MAEKADTARQQLEAVLSNPDATATEMVAAICEYISTLSVGVSAELQAVLSRFQETDKVIEDARGALFRELNRAMVDLEAERAAQEISYLEKKSVLEAEQCDIKKLLSALDRMAKLQEQCHRLKHGRGYEWLYVKLIGEKLLAKAQRDYERLKKEYNEKWGK